jgi:hypothetical protein
VAKEMELNFLSVIRNFRGVVPLVADFLGKAQSSNLSPSFQTCEFCGCGCGGGVVVVVVVELMCLCACVVVVGDAQKLNASQDE